MKKRRKYETTELAEKSSVLSKRISSKRHNRKIISYALEMHSMSGLGLLESLRKHCAVRPEGIKRVIV
jgi:hypothetical protein